MSTDLRTSVIPDELLQRIFANLVNKSRRHNSSRESRKKLDAFRSLLRHLPEITHRSTWEEVRPLVQDMDEFTALETEEERVAVFEKVIKRLKEKRDEQRRYRDNDSDRRREKEESVHRDGKHDSRGRRHYDEDDQDRSRERSRHLSQERSDRDLDYRKSHTRSRSYSRRDELDYGGDDAREGRGSKRRSEEDTRPGERKVRGLKPIY